MTNPSTTRKPGPNNIGGRDQHQQQNHGKGQMGGGDKTSQSGAGKDHGKSHSSQTK